MVNQQLGQVFVSYAHEDRYFREQLDRAFAAASLGHLTWTDVHGLEPGERWHRAIRRAIDESDGAILLVSEAFMCSEFIRNTELPGLVDKGFVIPVFIDQVELESGSAIGRWQAVNAPDEPVRGMDEADRERVWQDLVAQVANRLSETAEPTRSSDIVPAEDPMTPWIPVVGELGSVDGSTSTSDVAVVVRRSLGAIATVVLRADGADAPSSIDPNLSSEERAACHAVAGRAIERRLWDDSDARTRRRGATVTGQGPGRDLSMLFVPIEDRAGAMHTGLVVRRSDQPFRAAEGVMAIPMFEAMLEEGGGSTVEASVIDALRTEFGFVPERLYVRRRQLFSRQLDDLTVTFEPIVQLGRTGFSRVVGFEALARRVSDGELPMDLFRQSRLWGPKLVTELDEHMLAVAVDRFATQHQGQTHWRHELSVNVNPTSLAQASYAKTLDELLGREQRLPDGQLVLELSESEDLPTGPPAVEIDSTPWSRFRSRLSSLVRDYQVSFAIDDFGTGFASILRLVELDLHHVKLAREVLDQADPVPEINYLRARLANAASPPRLVAEGVEDDASFGPVDLYRSGVRFIQGFTFSRGGGDIDEIEAEAMNRLRELEPEIDRVAV